MELRTTFKIDPSPIKITYNDRVMFIGSCFASSVGSYLEMGKMPVMINPAGTVFNPASVCSTIDNIISEKVFVQSDLDFYNGTWFSFFHYTNFSSEDPLLVLDRINSKAKEAFSFLKGAAFLFITFGTARVYRLKKTGQIVSNCHKMPSVNFENRLLPVGEIVSLYTGLLERLRVFNPALKVIFTISPVRHWKDGAHGNQISKSVLFLAAEELLKHPVSPGYFPAYELVMDDLRDYRFYADDMLHPASMAIDYIWDAFSRCYLDSTTLNVWREVTKITKACNHRFNTTSVESKIRFAGHVLEQISLVEKKVPGIDLSFERSYFLKIYNDK